MVVTASNPDDALQLPALVDGIRTAGFWMDELLGDKGYLSRANLEVVGTAKAAPDIPFK